MYAACKSLALQLELIGRGRGYQLLVASCVEVRWVFMLLWIIQRRQSHHSSQGYFVLEDTVGTVLSKIAFSLFWSKVWKETPASCSNLGIVSARSIRVVCCGGLLLDQVTNSLVNDVLAIILVFIGIGNLILRTVILVIVRRDVSHETDIDFVQSLLFLRCDIFVDDVWIVLCLPWGWVVVILSKYRRRLLIHKLVRLLLND